MPAMIDDPDAPRAECDLCGGTIMLSRFVTFKGKTLNTSLRRHAAVCRDKTDEERAYFKEHRDWPPTARARALRERRGRAAS